MCMMLDAKPKRMQVDSNYNNENFYRSDQISELHLKSKSINLRSKNTNLLDLQKQLETLWPKKKQKKQNTKDLWMI